MVLKDNTFQLSGYRLPTEFEWDNATGDLSILIEYDSTIPTFASVGDTANKTTHAVGSLMPNRFGLFDMCGNISELTIRNDALTSKSQSFRGGSVKTKLEYLRDGLQSFSATSYSIPSFGFRVSRIIN